jgi:hypothetical protein
MLDKAFKGFTNTQYFQYLDKFFKDANKKYFGNKLTKPRFSQLKNMKDPRSYGLFVFDKRNPNHLEIKISPRL